MQWHLSGSDSKSATETNRLVEEALLAPDFKPQELSSFSFEHEATRLDKLDAQDADSFSPRDGWYNSSITLNVPCEGFSWNSEQDAPKFIVDNIIHRKLLDVVKGANSDPVASNYHYIPHQLYCRHPRAEDDTSPSNSQHTTLSDSESLESNDEFEDTRLYGEVYSSDAMLEEHE
ncbi:hypothetical protein NLI96_g12942 [Meripilus lineatus]|uniref:Uncharacterized protein n=1 Tax=Meripilus lineatus TaxID=2056292 RepID=A0AAD5UTL7_9APHY|nr:hypothetical protein NLI96_g12942 [Physisporinus lineatus]